MNQPTDTPRQMCCVPDCTEHSSWLRPVTERRVYAAASRVVS